VQAALLAGLAVQLDDAYGVYNFNWSYPSRKDGSQQTMAIAEVLGLGVRTVIDDRRTLLPPATVPVSAALLVRWWMASIERSNFLLPGIPTCGYGRRIR
jgi:hypothetical protein